MEEKEREEKEWYELEREELKKKVGVKGGNQESRGGRE